MNTYEVERIDRNGDAIGKRKIAADTFSIEDNGTLWLYDSARSDEHNPAGAILVFAPGAWGQLLLLDETAAQAKTNAITHPVATADEMDAIIKGGLPFSMDGYRFVMKTIERIAREELTS